MFGNNQLTDRKRLDSWKEIAGFFGRDERTVNRWEKDLALPVHRLPGTKGRVYAFTDELSAWMAAPDHATAAATANSTTESSSESTSASQRLTVIPGRVKVESAQPESPSGGEVLAPSVGRYRNLVGIRVLAAAILGIGAVALAFLHPSPSRSSRTPVPASKPHPNSLGSVALASSPAHDPEAEQLYLKGRYYWNQRTPDDLNKALDYFMQAVVHDPNYSQAYVGLADCYNLMREYTLMPSSEAYRRALAAAKKAVELDDQSSEAHASLAFVSFFGMWDVATGEREFRRAIDLNPNNPASHQWYANALLALHRWPEALVEIDRAQALDPASAAILADKGNVLQVIGRRDEALTLLKQLEARDPAFRSPHIYLKYLYARNGDNASFIAELRKDAVLVHDDSAAAIATAAEKGFAAGGRQTMLEAMLRVQKQLYAQHSLPPLDIAQTYAKLGNKNEALRCLNAAYEQHDGSLLFVETYPEFDTLHDTPAYRDLLARLNLPPQSAP